MKAEEHPLSQDEFPNHPPCPTCRRRVFLNDELAQKIKGKGLVNAKGYIEELEARNLELLKAEQERDSLSKELERGANQYASAILKIQELEEALSRLQTGWIDVFAKDTEEGMGQGPAQAKPGRGAGEHI